MQTCAYPRCDRIIYHGEGADGKHCWNHVRLTARQEKEKATGKAPKQTLQCQFGIGRVQCPNPARAGGLCTKHYQRQRRTQLAQEREVSRGTPDV